MTTPNEIALYGLSLDGGVTWHDPESYPPQLMPNKYAAFLNECLDAANDPGFPYRYSRISSLPAALNAERNEKRVEVLEAIVLGLIGGPNPFDFKNGYYDPIPTQNHLFKCEYCYGEHLDFTQIEHAEACPVRLGRAALNPKEGE